MSFDRHTELQLLEILEDEPETTQADLAARVGVAVGTVNWYLKRWSAKGYVKVKRIGRWRWRYLLTPQGMAEKAQLAGKYVEASMRIYRQTRAQARQMMEDVRAAGYQELILDGDDDVADVCRLTCLEYGLHVADDDSGELPKIVVNGYRLELTWPDGSRQMAEGHPPAGGLSEIRHDE